MDFGRGVVVVGFVEGFEGFDEVPVGVKGNDLEGIVARGGGGRSSSSSELLLLPVKSISTRRLLVPAGLVGES